MISEDPRDTSRDVCRASDSQTLRILKLNDQVAIRWRNRCMYMYTFMGKGSRGYIAPRVQIYSRVRR